MPWKRSDVESHIKGLSDHQQTVWVRVANRALARCEADGDSECDARAIRQANAMAKRAPKTAQEAQLIPLETALELISTAGAEGDAFREAELSLDQKRSSVQSALHAQMVAPAKDSYCWVRDLFDTYVIYEVEGKGGTELYRRDYSVADDGSVTLGDPQRVKLVSTYEPVTESQTEAEAEEFAGDLVPLIERALRDDGTFQFKAIAPGWGSSGYYSAELLQRDGPKVFGEGTHIYFDHPSRSEERDRPERSLRDLAAVTVSAATWQEEGPDGPGLYAQAKPFSNYAPLISEIAPHIGMSIRASGYSKPGEVEGRKGPVIERFAQGHSIDLVTKAGAGGKVLSLIESARPQPSAAHERARDAGEKETGMATDAEFQALQESVARLEEQNRALLQEQARAHEAALLREARELVTTVLARAAFPLEETRQRLTEQLTANPPTKDDAAGGRILDREVYLARIEEAVRAEAAYLAKLTGGNPIHGMGPSGSAEVSAEEAEKQLVGALGVFGLSEAAARMAVGGR